MPQAPSAEAVARSGFWWFRAVRGPPGGPGGRSHLQTRGGCFSHSPSVKWRQRLDGGHHVVRGVRPGETSTREPNPAHQALVNEVLLRHGHARSFTRCCSHTAVAAARRCWPLTEASPPPTWSLVPRQKDRRVSEEPFAVSLSLTSGCGAWQVSRPSGLGRRWPPRPPSPRMKRSRPRGPG